MSVDIVMPNLGFDMQEARIVEWHKQPGDPVHKGELIAVVESDKSNVELESIADGIVLEHLFAAGEVAPVGAAIARVGRTDEQKPMQSPPEHQPDKSPAPGKQVTISPVARRFADATSRDNGQRSVLAVPKVRKAAREAGIDLKAVQPRGAHGQVTLADLDQHQAAEQPRSQDVPTQVHVDQQPSAVPVAVTPDMPALHGGGQEVAISRMRRTIGRRLSKSMQDAPHFYVSGEFDLEGALAALKGLPEPRPRINDVIQYLTVQALRQVPELNATYENGHLYQQRAIHLAVAVALEDGLITPVISNADDYSLTGLAAESRALIERLRANRLRQQDLSAGTFTISNLGVVKQVEQFTAVINPPQVAILAVGTVKQRPFVIDGGLFVRHTVKLTLSGDHRAVDGMTLAKFMAAFQSGVDHFGHQ